MSGLGGMDPRMLELMMSDPEIMALMSRPDVMRKIQTMASNPSSAMQFANDPDLQLIARKMQQLGMSPQGGPSPYPAPSPAAPSASGGGSVIEVTSSAQFNQAISGAAGKLVVVDFFAEWCGPCKAIAPTVKSMAAAYPKVTFLKVDGDKNRALTALHKVEAYPTFHFYKNGSLIDELKGANAKQLENLVTRYMDADETKEEVSPFKSFPLKEDEAVKYDTIKWDIVESKIEEFGTKLSAPHRLEALDIALLHSLCSTLAKREEYLQSSISDDEFELVTKLLQWPQKSLPPVLNLVRGAVFHSSFAQLIIKSPTFLSNLLIILETADASELNLTQVMQFFCNCLVRRSLSVFVLEHAENILNAIASLTKHENKKVKQIVSCLLLNFSVAILYRKNSSANKGESLDFGNVKLQCLSSSIELLIGEQSAPAIYRLVVIIGTLVYRDEETKTVASTMELESVIDGISAGDSNLTEARAELKRCLGGEA
eukprot:TRINITY_DN3580_c0_g1_i1.p1 TRINITY_DN3580_c0_g1~~TRINITY_DN3580_c0_g1_i1.p1  ORF type:complete len:485 (-),score=120.71 TRINITY_DN3580_c0_g1_i1:3168-4622(-)